MVMGYRVNQYYAKLISVLTHCALFVFRAIWPKTYPIYSEKAIPVKERIREIEAFEEGIANAVSSRNEEKHTPLNRTVTSQPILEPSSEHQQLKESIEKETEALLNTCLYQIFNILWVGNLLK